jgi:hypothetical protein
MKLRILVVAAIVVGVTLIPATAWAKGAKAVTITGPGLEQPVHVAHTPAPKSVTASRLAQATGLYYAAFRTTPTPMTDTRPAGRLGPRYRAVYELYAAAGTVTVRQDLYPFAAAGFVSHTPSGQRVSAGTTPGGWYVATDSFNGVDSRSATAMLVALGAPDRRSRSVRSAGVARAALVIHLA